jgi:hypothetical protein
LAEAGIVDAEGRERERVDALSSMTGSAREVVATKNAAEAEALLDLHH